MENVYKLLHIVFYVVVFFLAIMLLYRMYKQFIHLADYTAENLTGDNLVVEILPIDTEHLSTRDDILAYLMGELEYDIEVIDQTGIFTIEAEEYNPGIIGLYSFTSDFYKKIYNYHLNGEISKIIFKYVTA